MLVKGGPGVTETPVEYERDSKNLASFVHIFNDIEYISNGEINERSIKYGIFCTFVNVFWKPTINIIIIIWLVVVLISTPGASGVNWSLPTLFSFITLC